MAISRKGTRKIVVDNREYIWWVRDDTQYLDHFKPVLIISTMEKNFRIAYNLEQDGPEHTVLVTGSYFKGVANLGKGGRRFVCPQFSKNGIITPKDVAAMIIWAHNTDGTSMEINWPKERPHTEVPNGVAKKLEPPAATTHKKERRNHRAGGRPPRGNP